MEIRPRRLPPLNALRAFEAAARHLSFTRAAAELNVTQAAVSQQVRNLEDWLGRRLFVRRPRELRLTAAGAAYRVAVEAALDDLAQATARLTGAGGRDDVLTVTLTPTFLSRWLLPHLSSWQAARPDIELRLNATGAVVDLGREDVDVAIRSGDGRWPGHRCDLLFEENLVPVAAPALVGRGGLSAPGDLHRFERLHNRMTPDWWRMWLNAAGERTADPERGLWLDDGELVLQAAERGLGVAIAPRHLVARELAEGRLVAALDSGLARGPGYWLVAPETTADSRKVAAFRDWLLAELGAAAD